MKEICSISMHFKAAKIIREIVLIGSVLNHSESWINITKQDLEKLENLTVDFKKMLCTLNLALCL